MHFFLDLLLTNLLVLKPSGSLFFFFFSLSLSLSLSLSQSKLELQGERRRWNFREKNFESFNTRFQHVVRPLRVVELDNVMDNVMDGVIEVSACAAAAGAAKINNKGKEG